MSLVAILDADKEGFLRSETSLIQIIGRAARNVSGRVIMYADEVTDSMRSAIDETLRRRNLQMRYNEEHGIDPQTIRKKVADILELVSSGRTKPTRPDRRLSGRMEVNAPLEMASEDLGRLIQSLEDEMREAARELRFEYAARLRDEVSELKREMRELSEVTG